MKSSNTHYKVNLIIIHVCLSELDAFYTLCGQRETTACACRGMRGAREITEDTDISISYIKTGKA